MDLISGPSEGTPEHSQLVTPNYFRNILSVPWKVMTGERKWISSKSMALLVKNKSPERKTAINIEHEEYG
jgi:hypothetical protein